MKPPSVQALQDARQIIVKSILEESSNSYLYDLQAIRIDCDV